MPSSISVGGEVLAFLSGRGSPASHISISISGLGGEVALVSAAAVQPGQELVQAARRVGPDQGLAPGGSWASASCVTAMWSAAVLGHSFHSDHQARR
jgi:hypothetical protein